ncbi:MAG TPA: hypothetical protein VG817_02410 [Gemmatimonadales bacterium]|nr:hypothetical protein [Gemmatimonadales bacterium]
MSHLATPRWIILAAVAIAACSTGPKAPTAELALLPTGDTVLAPYGDIAAAAPYGEHRWVLVAPQEPAVGIADFSTHRLSPFATGAAARELSQPFFLFASGDSIYIADWQQRRLTAWSHSGVRGGETPAAAALRGALPRGRDGQGRWYFELKPNAGADGSGNRDSAAIVRTSPDLAQRDTVARLAPPELVEVLNDGRRRMERRLLSGQDRWGVTGDGRVWVARVSENRIDWRNGGETKRGAQLPDRVLTVTDNDRELFLNKFQPELRATVEQTPFAVVKPPFEDGLTDADGRVWLVKSRAIGDSLRYYQVVDSTGRLVASVAHAGHGRILALTDSLAIVGEPFEDGMRLLLFRLPAFPTR